jgi:PAS domain S-box-containing protein
MSRPPRILIVDDEFSIRKTFRYFLIRAGYEVETTEDLKSAVEMLETGDFHLVVADIVLTGQTGMSLLESIKAAGKNIPVVMITGQPTIDTAAESLRLGAFDYIPKPVDKRTLLRVTELALRHKEMLDRETELTHALMVRERRLYSMLQNTTESTFLLDTAGYFIAANPEGARRMGMTVEEVVGKHFTENIPQETAEERTAVFESVLSEKKSVRFENRRDDLILDLSVSPVLDEAGNVESVAVFGRDITLQRHLENALSECQKRLAEKPDGKCKPDDSND